MQTSLVSTFYYAWNWSESLVWWWVVVGGGGGWWWLKATLVFIFGPNLKARTLLRPRPKLNNFECFCTFCTFPTFLQNLSVKCSPSITHRMYEMQMFLLTRSTNAITWEMHFQCDTIRGKNGKFSTFGGKLFICIFIFFRWDKLSLSWATRHFTFICEGWMGRE